VCETYAAWTSSSDGLRNRYIDRVLALGLRWPAAALYLGCGTGRHATAYLVELGFEVTGIDISPASIAKARQELPGARFQVADMATVELAPSSFDLITAFYSLIHVPKEEHAGVLAGS
jgi:ubiquinone/menaquinone biosynthesis C-methylase UbiE